MVRILGNSSERVEVKDLNDIIYYRQLKEYTDQEYERSKDLKREIQNGRLAKIEELTALRGSVDIQRNSASSVSAKDLRIALREVLPEFKGNGSEDIKSAVREIAPLIVDMVRQEMSKISITGIKPKVVSPFIGPEYIPEISTEGMKDSVKPKERKVSADDVADNLAALRKLKKNKS